MREYDILSLQKTGNYIEVLAIGILGVHLLAKLVWFHLHSAYSPSSHRVIVSLLTILEARPRGPSVGVKTRYIRC